MVRTKKSHNNNNNKTTIAEGGGGEEGEEKPNRRPPPTNKDHHPTVRRIRARADSTGSTRGAFYDSEHAEYQIQAPKLEDVAPAVILTTTKKSSRKKKPRHTPAEHSMAEVANLALQDFLDDDQQQQAFGASGLTPPTTIETNHRKKYMTTTNYKEQNDDDDEFDRNSDNFGMTSSYFSQLAHTPKTRSREIRETPSKYSMAESGRQSLYGTDLIQDTSSASNPTSSSLHSSSYNYRTTATTTTSQQEEINLFSQMAKSSTHYYGSVQQQSPPPSPRPPLPPKIDRNDTGSSHDPDVSSSEPRQHRDYQKKRHKEDLDDSSYAGLRMVGSLAENIHHLFHDWLTAGSYVGEDGHTHFDEYHTYSVAGFVRYMLYHPITPEFTSLQQFNWAVIIGIIMGVYTAYWKQFIELGVEFFWLTVPKKLLEWGVFTGIDGRFPLFHYMWILPAIMAGLLSWMFVVFPIKLPGQNEWISNIHSRGVQDHNALIPLFVLSTMGMWSGLSLGPELPLVLTGGMFGSWLALLTRQSMLQARILNITAASAAVGGFFGFPMAGALFVLELPHRMGLQYFEALSPGTIASITAVLANRIILHNDVTGYFSYPFLTATLPSSIFTSSLVYGVFGCGIGILYLQATKFLKGFVHGLFHRPWEDFFEKDAVAKSALDLSVRVGSDESEPLVTTMPNSRIQDKLSVWRCLKSYFCFSIRDESKRAAVAGVVAGIMVGVVGIFLPHTMFWGEAQLQNLIDKGRTPLPIFGEGSEPTAAFTKHAVCMIDNEDAEAIRNGFSIGCSSLIAVAKTVVVGLSLGTGIIGGQFWGPLYVGCAASHLLTDVVNLLHDKYGFSTALSAYPCVVILCTMGSTHVVLFRAHMAIMLILTLTISAFNPDQEDSNSPFKVAGDYSAVFPLLVVSVFVSLMLSRSVVFYSAQTSRGDISAVPEVLCQPNKVGAPLVVGYDLSGDDDDSFFDSIEGDSTKSSSDVELASSKRGIGAGGLTQQDIEQAFADTMAKNNIDASIFVPLDLTENKVPELSSNRLDELLAKPINTSPRRLPHRRTQSASPIMTQSERIDHQMATSYADNRELPPSVVGGHSRSNSGTSQKGLLVQVFSFGDIKDHQPSLIEQARMRSSSSVAEQSRHRRIPSQSSLTSPSRGGHRRVPSLPSRGGSKGRHSRSSSLEEGPDLAHVLSQIGSEPGGALSIDDINQSFNAVVNQKVVGGESFVTGNKSPWTRSI